MRDTWGATISGGARPSDVPFEQRAVEPIPIDAARHVAALYGYDEVIVIGFRASGRIPTSSMATHGITAEHSDRADKIGAGLRAVMGWLE